MRCEEYPACGHEPGNCDRRNGTSGLIDAHEFARISRDDYDPYYDN